MSFPAWMLRIYREACDPWPWLAGAVLAVLVLLVVEGWSRVRRGRV